MVHRQNNAEEEQKPAMGSLYFLSQKYPFMVVFEDLE